MSTDVIEITAAAALGLAFAWAALAKLAGVSRWRRALAALELPAPLSAAARWAVPGAEVLTSALLLLGPVSAGAALAVALLTVFSAVVLLASRRHGARLPCACFGGRAERDYRLLLGRNAALTAVALAVLALGGKGSGLDALDAPPGGEVLPLALAALGVAVAAWAAQQARIALRRGDGGR